MVVKELVVQLLHLIQYPQLAVEVVEDVLQRTEMV